MEEQITHQRPNLQKASKFDRWITIAEAAVRIRHSKSWIYARRGRLPFVLRTPEGSLRVSVRKLKEWMSQAETG